MNVSHANVVQNVIVATVASAKMKISLLLGITNLISLASAHTGNDMYDHHMTFYDGVLGGLVIIAVILLIVYLIKQIKKK